MRTTVYYKLVWAGESIDSNFRRYLDYKDKRIKRRYLGRLWVLTLIKKATTQVERYAYNLIGFIFYITSKRDKDYKGGETV
jgi:hypothetical protein